MMRRYGLFALALVLGIGAGLRDHVDDWIAQTQLPPVLVETSREVRDRHGALLRVYPVEGGRVRMASRLADVDPDFLAMLIAYEDKRFYHHKGVDLRAAMRAAAQAVWAGQVVSGGSTLTMQVARLLENSGTGHWRGKLRQVRLALALEQSLTKNQILELYLAHAPYGGAVEGLRAGALAWFGKTPARLSQEEAALLVALPQAPETRRPDRAPVVATAARNRVLARVQAERHRHALPVPAEMRPFVRLAPHLADRAMLADPVAQHHALTIDGLLQRQMEYLAARAVKGQPSDLSAALVVADYQTGEILASVGSPAYADTDGSLGFIDMTDAVRSPGSTLKPFIYGMAFDQGMAHPDMLIQDAPVQFGRYAPQNFDGRFRGELPVREALQLSLNIPPVLLLQELGPARLMALLRQGGAAPQLSGGKPGLAVALGGVGLKLNGLVQLYGGLANGGVVQPLVWRLGAEKRPSFRLMSRSAAWQVSHSLAGLAPPAGFAVQRHKIAYKTGTSYGHRDAWAIGFDGAHVIGVWLGRPDGTPVPGAFGGDLAAPILFEAFGRLKPDPVPLPVPPPETLILSNADLPLPLRRFRSRDAAFIPAADAPRVAFPPEGAVLRKMNTGVPLKLRAGVLPLTVLVDGAPVMTNLRQREAILPMSEPGYSRISVIDAQGRGASVNIRLQ